MKLTSKILLAMLLLFTVGLFASNSLLKKEYETKDKSDIYWTYDVILTKPFKYLDIEGGNVSTIAYEPGKESSVRIYKDWDGFKTGRVKADVRSDTLFIKFSNTNKDIYEKQFLRWATALRIFSPELLSVKGVDTKLEMFKLKQKSISVDMSGKSSFEIESMITSLDSIHISGRDSSSMQIEVSPDYKTTESFHINTLSANLQGYSILDVGHAQVDSLRLTIEDSSAIILSGGTLKKNDMYNTVRQDK